ncbi:response regulator [Reichenbachiella sp.]|uniref:response regulator n=1 Tax=Reichenbachiella sp. TaxID=2184521 RepID=UPI00329A472C
MKKQQVDSLLMIDDDDLWLMMNTIVIDRSQAVNTVVQAKSGALALRFLEQSKDDWPQIIFCDIQMPIMNGWEFFDQYYERFDQNRDRSMLCMLSSSQNEIDRQYFIERSYLSMYLTKPLNPQQLEEVIHYYQNEFKLKTTG